MLDGILIYTEYEANRNKFFIDKLISAAKRCNIDLELVICEKARFDFSKSGLAIFYEEKVFTKIDFVILRVMNYTLATRFEKCGVRVYNSSYISKIADNKYLTYLEMKKSGIEVLDTHLQWDIDEKNIFYPNVTKPIDSKGGDRVYLNNDFDEYKKNVNAYKDTSFIMQKVATNFGKDLRAYVIGERIVASILRTSKDGFISNFCKGGKPSIYTLDTYERKVVEKIISYIKPDYVGIDFLFSKDGIVLNEIENVVGARMVYELTDIDIAKSFIEYISEHKNLST